MGRIDHASKRVLVGLAVLIFGSVFASASTPDSRVLPIRRSFENHTLILDDGGQWLWVDLIGVGTSMTPDPDKPVPFRLGNAPEKLGILVPGRSATLVDDPAFAGRPSWRRRVAYAERVGDGLDMGWALIRHGWAYARRDHDYARRESYQAAEAEARAEGAGLWPDPSPPKPGPEPGLNLATAPSPAAHAEWERMIQDTARRRAKRHARMAERARAGRAGFPMYGPGMGMMGGMPGGMMGGGLPASNGPWNGYTVHVDGYYRRNGTYVGPHNRRPPGMATYP